MRGQAGDYQKRQGRQSLAAGKRGAWGVRREAPSAIPDSEFGDPELGPLCMRDMLRNATFLGFFENLGNQLFDASS